MICGIGVACTNMSGIRRHDRGEAGREVDGVEHGKALTLAGLAVDLPEGRGQVHDAGAVLGGHEVGRDHHVRLLGPSVWEGHEVERPLVVQADERGGGEVLDDLGVCSLSQHSLHPRCGDHDVATVATGTATGAHTHVVDIGADGRGDVGDERPRCGRPHHEVEVTIATGKRT